MDKTIGLLGVPSSMGAFAPGQEKAPGALSKAGLVEQLARAGDDVDDHGDLAVRRWVPDRAHHTAQHALVIGEVVRETSTAVERMMANGQAALVLGGDCTIELGTVSGVLSTGQAVGLIYLDLHPDLNVPTAVPDGALDWMGLAHLIGIEGALAELAQAGPFAPMLDPDRVVLLGYDPSQSTAFERAAIEQYGITAIPVENVAASPEAAATAALAAIPDTADSVLVHFDVDIVDFTDLPLSEERVRNRGLTFEQAMRALGTLVADERFAGLTITELNPDHGAEDGSTLKSFVQELAAVMAPR